MTAIDYIFVAIILMTIVVLIIYAKNKVWQNKMNDELLPVAKKRPVEHGQNGNEQHNDIEPNGEQNHQNGFHRTIAPSAKSLRKNACPLARGRVAIFEKRHGRGCGVAKIVKIQKNILELQIGDGPIFHRKLGIVENN